MGQLTYRAEREPLVSPDGIELYPRDMTATLGAQASLAAVQAKLADVNQWLPIDGDANAPVGRLVEENSTGPLRLGFGAWRDLLLGMQFLNGRRELISAGGRTMKNVAGYDLTKFMVGQRQVFGRLATITTRTYLRPSASLHARFSPDAKITDLIPTPLRPQWSILTPEGLSVGYLGDRRTIEFVRGRLPNTRPTEIGEIADLPADQQRRAALWNLENLTLRAAIAPSHLAQFAAAAGLTRWVADAAFGLLLSNQQIDPSKARSAIEAVGGSLLHFHEGKLLASPAPDAALLSLMKDLKAAFDPDNTLEPLPWIS